jgi:hypothetical protein
MLFGRAGHFRAHYLPQRLSERATRYALRQTLAIAAGISVQPSRLHSFSFGRGERRGAVGEGVSQYRAS